MKPKSIFRSLPIEDQRHIIDLCNHHTYDEVLVILARPRPEGLQLHTSYSALCRFYCSWNDEARKTRILEQTAASLQYSRQAAHGAMRAGILTLLETHIFEALRAGTPVADLKAEFAALKEIHKSYLAEERSLRESRTHPDLQWREHKKATAEPPYDFAPLDQNGEPTEAPPFTPEETAEIEKLDSDYYPAKAIAAIPEVDETLASRGPEAARKEALAAGCSIESVRAGCEAHRKYLTSRGITALQAAAEVRLAQIKRAAAQTRAAAIQVLPPADISTSNHQKTPQIHLIHQNPPINFMRKPPSPTARGPSGP